MALMHNFILLMRLAWLVRHLRIIASSSDIRNDVRKNLKGFWAVRASKWPRKEAGDRTKQHLRAGTQAHSVSTARIDVISSHILYQ